MGKKNPRLIASEYMRVRSIIKSKGALAKVDFINNIKILGYIKESNKNRSLRIKPNVFEQMLERLNFSSFRKLLDIDLGDLKNMNDLLVASGTDKAV